MSDEELILALENDTLDPDNFHHRDHVRLPWCLLRRDPCPAALVRFSGIESYETLR